MAFPFITASPVIQSLPVPGLYFIPLFISESEEQDILQFLDTLPWSTELSRRVMHFGRKYNYRAKTAEPTVPMIGLIESIAQRIVSYSGFLGDLAPAAFDMCIVNEYTRSQGIAGHVDAAIFGPVIYSLSLNEDTVMKFTSSTGYCVPIFVPRFSLLVMTGAARYEWNHGIDKKVSYMVNGYKTTKLPSYRRISLTYRTMASL